MSRFVRALAALLTLALTAPPATAGAGDGEDGPRLRVEPVSFDFGRAQRERSLRKEFTLRNLGDRELVIESVSTTCGCTAAVAGDRRVAPGRSTPLVVTLETRRYSGRVERRVLVRSNDPKTPLLEIVVAVTVEAPAAKP